MTPHARNSRVPWVGLAALVSGYVLAFVVRYGTAVVLPGLRADFGADEAALGVLSAAYFWPYALTQPIAGLLADFWGPRRSVALFLAGAAAGTLLFALAPIYPLAIVGRALGGAGVGIVYVCGISAVGLWFKPERFGTASGLYAATGTLGGLVAARPLAALVEVMGWRGAFALMAAALLITAVVAFLAIPESPRVPGQLGFRQAIGGFRWALRLPNVWLTGAYTFIILGILSSMQGLWTVPFLTEVYGLESGGAATVLEAWSIGLLVGIPFWGTLTDRLTRSRKWTIEASILLHALPWIVLLIAPAGVPRPALYAFFLYAAFTNGCWMPAYALVRSSSPAAIAGTALGLLNFAFFFGAAVFQQATGVLLAQFPRVGTRLPAEAYRSLFGLFVAGLAVAAVAVAFTRDTPAEPSPAAEAGQPEPDALSQRPVAGRSGR